MPKPRPTFFATAADLRRWFAKHHASADELWLGYYKRGSGHRSVTYAEAVDEALCVGWIDGVVNSIDAQRYMQRYTPRRPTSIWSNINVGKVKRLVAEGRMKPAGLRAFKARTAKRTGVYSFEQRRPPELTPADVKRFKANKRAWQFFESQPPSYQRPAIHWVTQAKREQTRASRLATLIADSAASLRVKHLRPLKPKYAKTAKPKYAKTAKPKR